MKLINIAITATLMTLSAQVAANINDAGEIRFIGRVVAPAECVMSSEMICQKSEHYDNHLVSENTNIKEEIGYNESKTLVITYL
ncbi:hypothetical protein [Photobacterium damselae]|uniref:hypothetical protein n=1 Tax=Photobacterium damselae TaxID=38293 RepID=UPI00165D4A53|nr:hypothetical protein [Photobacterium damselae]